MPGATPGRAAGNDPRMNELIHAVAERLGRAKRVVVLTGAGISAESGIPTFRDTMAGLWKEFDPAKLATPEAFARDPEMVTKWYDTRRLGCASAEPNAGHRALAAMEAGLVSHGARMTLLTQNVDRLHQRAGSREVVELHGTIMEWRCARSGKKVSPPEPPAAFGKYPPRSPHGEGFLRPDVVWFGEMLPEAALSAAFAALDACDVFLSVGTSSVVHPAAGFVEVAGSRGAVTVEVNREPTPISRAVDYALHGAAGEILPRIVETAWGKGAARAS